MSPVHQIGFRLTKHAFDNLICEARVILDILFNYKPQLNNIETLFQVTNINNVLQS